MARHPPPPSTQVDSPAGLCLWRCACGRVDEQPGASAPGACLCGLERAWTLETGTTPEQGAPLLASLAARGRARPRLSSGIAELDRALGGGWLAGSAVLLFGRPGTGKSRIAYRCAGAAPPVLLVDLEMGAELALLAATGSGLDPGRVYYAPELAGWPARARAARARVVVIDSVTEAGARRAAGIMRELRDWARSSSGLGIGIAHESGSGRAWGGGEQEHGPDYVIRASAAASSSVLLACSKNRGGGRWRVEIELLSGAARNRTAQIDGSGN